MKQIVGHIKYIEVNIPKTVSEYFLSQVECARRYHHLPPDIIREVSHIHYQLNKLQKSELYFTDKLSEVQSSQVELKSKLQHFIDLNAQVEGGLHLDEAKNKIAIDSDMNEIQQLGSELEQLMRDLDSNQPQSYYDATQDDMLSDGDKSKA
jgi:hypothetical protein